MCWVLQANPNVFILAIVYTTLDVVGTKPKLVLYIVGGAIFLLQSLVCRSRGACLPVPTFGIAQGLDIGLHHPLFLAELSGNISMCQWEGQLVFIINVICATPCPIEFKDSSMCILLALLFGRGIE